jgi:uncharacterized membrane protein YkvA (DUF1232 family)
MRLLRLIPLLFTRFRKELVLLLHILRHAKTPKATKLLAVIALAYLISPIDLIPDFIPVIGLLDDIGVVALLLKIGYSFLPDGLYDTLRAKVYGGSPATVNTVKTRRGGVVIDVTPEKG